MLLLQRLQLAVQGVVVGIADLGTRLDKVKAVVTRNLLP